MRRPSTSASCAVADEAARWAPSTDAKVRLALPLVIHPQLEIFGRDLLTRHSGELVDPPVSVPLLVVAPFDCCGDHFVEQEPEPALFGRGGGKHFATLPSVRHHREIVLRRTSKALNRLDYIVRRLDTD